MIYESVKDRIVNRFLQIKSWFRSFKKYNEWGREEPSTNLLICRFEDNFRSFDTNKWRVSQPWGRFHKDNPTQYYGDDSVYIENGHLVLDTKYDPQKGLTVWDSDNAYDIDWSVGLVTSLQSFGYGFYEFQIGLPIGEGLWPAVWLSAVDSWPPEIDILEAYSDEKGKYDKRLQTNLHFDFNENKKNSGPRNHVVSKPLHRMKVSCYWCEDFIKIYYNGFLIRKITSKKVLKWFKDKKMIIILNNAIRREYIDFLSKDKITKFKIYSVKYWN